VWIKATGTTKGNNAHDIAVFSSVFMGDCDRKVTLESAFNSYVRGHYEMYLTGGGSVIGCPTVRGEARAKMDEDIAFYKKLKWEVEESGWSY
jgi:hypothetical protein